MNQRRPTIAVLPIQSLIDQPSEECLDWLAKAVDERDPQIFWLKAAALYDPLRSDPRLDQLLEKIGFE